MRQFIKRLVHLALPKNIGARKLPRGLANGAVATIDFRYDAAFYFGRHEPELWPHYKKLLKPGMRCFDIGMYRGWDALTFASLTMGDVISFDCNPMCLKMTSQFLEPSGVKVTLVQAFISDGTQGTKTIDEASAEYFEPDFIKIDIEGGEAAALRGARRLLLSRHPSLVIETHGNTVEAECLKNLKDCGYTPLVVNRTDSIFSEARSLKHNRWLVCYSGGKP
jgi:hypothetical protein